MNSDRYSFLKLLTHSTYGEFYEVLDYDGIRKPAIEVKIMDVSSSPKGAENANRETYRVIIDWRLLNMLMESDLQERTK